MIIELKEIDWAYLIKLKPDTVEEAAMLLRLVNTVKKADPLMFDTSFDKSIESTLFIKRLNNNNFSNRISLNQRLK